VELPNRGKEKGGSGRTELWSRIAWSPTPRRQFHRARELFTHGVRSVMSWLCPWGPLRCHGMNIIHRGLFAHSPGRGHRDFLALCNEKRARSPGPRASTFPDSRRGFRVLRRYAFVRQADGSDCGAAALAAVALHYCIPIPLQQLRDLAGTDRAGTSLLGLLRAAEKLGLSGKGVKGPYESLAHVPLPAIAHLKATNGLGPFVVLYRVQRN